MEAVAHGHGASPSRLQHRVRTFAGWKSQRLECGSLGLAFHRLNRAVRVFYEEGLEAEMLDARNGDVIAPVRVWRPSARTVAVSFPKRLLRPGLTRYAWSAHTATWGRGACPPFEGDPGEDNDRARNRGGIIHDLGSRRLTGRGLAQEEGR